MPSVQKYFEDMLRIFGGYIDFGMLFFIDSEQDYKNVFETEFAGYAERLKRQGDILHIGFSSHNPAIAMKAIGTGLPEIMMFSINPAFDMLPSDKYVFDHVDSGFGADMFRGLDPERAKLYKLCAQKQIGITVMKSLGAGKLLSDKQTPFSAPLTAIQCVGYALSRPAVASVLTGCKSRAEVDDVMKYLTCGDAEKDYSHILSGVRNDFAGNCLYCSHCQPCEAGIDIAAVHRLLDAARLDAGAIPAQLRSAYGGFEKNGADCIKCGHCENRCPFGVPVMENMERAESLLGK
jgi:predicted aldo/keto reductase-like oxidoreductase